MWHTSHPPPPTHTHTHTHLKQRGWPMSRLKIDSIKPSLATEVLATNSSYVSWLCFSLWKHIDSANGQFEQKPGSLATLNPILKMGSKFSESFLYFCRWLKSACIKYLIVYRSLNFLTFCFLKSAIKIIFKCYLCGLIFEKCNAC